MSEIEEGKGIDSSRRDFLKKSVAAGAVVWAAPVVTSLPGGRVWAAPYPCPNPAGPCVGTAYGLKVSVGSIVIGPIPSAPGPSPTCLINPVVNPIITLAATVCGDVTLNSAQACRYDGYVENLDLSVIGLLGITLLRVQADVLHATAGNHNECPPCEAFGFSEIANLRINGGLISVTSPCNTVIPVPGTSPLVTVHLNEQTCGPNGIIVNALRVTTAPLPAVGVVEIIAGHAEAGRSGCTCVVCS